MSAAGPGVLGELGEFALGERRTVYQRGTEAAGRIGVRVILDQRRSSSLTTRGGGLLLGCDLRAPKTAGGACFGRIHWAALGVFSVGGLGRNGDFLFSTGTVNRSFESNFRRQTSLLSLQQNS